MDLNRHFSKEDIKVTNRQRKSWGFPGGTSGKGSPASAGDTRDEGLILGSRTILWRRKGQPSPALLGNFHGRSSLVGCLWYHKGPCKTEQLRTHTDTKEEVTQHHRSPGKCKSESQQGGTSHLVEWLLSKREKVHVSKNVGERETLYTVGGKVNWSSHNGKRYGNSLK